MGREEWGEELCSYRGRFDVRIVTAGAFIEWLRRHQDEYTSFRKAYDKMIVELDKLDQKWFWSPVDDVVSRSEKINEKDV